MLAHKGELTIETGVVDVTDIDEKNKREYNCFVSIALCEQRILNL